MKKYSFSETRGFTLIELAMVLFIISVVVALTAPGIVKSFGTLSLRTASKKVGATLRYSRSQAVNTGSTYNTIFDTGKNRVVVLQIPAPLAPDLNVNNNETEEDPEEIESSTRLPRKEIKTYPLPDGIIFEQIIVADIDSSEQEEDGIYQITFSPNGTSRGGEIILTDKKERRIRIRVNPITGVVIVAEEDDEDE